MNKIEFEHFEAFNEADVEALLREYRSYNNIATRNINLAATYVTREARLIAPLLWI